jgi:hypothetical protein
MAKIIKGEKRGRPDKWIVDYRDQTGTRRWKTFDTKREAEDFYAERVRERGNKLSPAVNRNVTLAEYAETWLKTISVGVKESSVIVYDGQLRRNILPEFGQTKVRDMDRGVIKHFLVGLRQRFSWAYTKQASATLSGLLSSAVDDELLVATRWRVSARSSSSGGRRGSTGTSRRSRESSATCFLRPPNVRRHSSTTRNSLRCS